MDLQDRDENGLNAVERWANKPLVILVMLGLLSALYLSAGATGVVSWWFVAFAFAATGWAMWREYKRSGWPPRRPGWPEDDQ